jgi:GGDEF domain-containing protein
VSRLRDHVRPSDLVGRLGAREIGMLLHDVQGSSAQAVTDRLRQAIHDAHGGEPVPVTVGCASREPGMPEAQLAQRAREEARRASGSPEVRQTI